MLEKTYDPRQVEDRIYQFWEDHRLFRPEVNAEADGTYSIVIPPPNVTGTLHMGHALDNTLQDILIRWQRMAGTRTLWMPGMDHAGIATQNVVERNLREKGLSKFDLGREKFLDEVWAWANARKQDIKNQFQRLGISPDWERTRFTLDEGCSQTVREAFVTLYERGLIYRGARIVNWCPRCTSAISDIETEYTEQESHLWEISYPLKDAPGALVVATTRPETMFGDVAVAVNPNDPRFAGTIGKTVVLPLANAEIPVIGDDYVDVSFGTGALKITPAHDPNDFEIAQRHGLAPVWVMDESGKMKADARVPEDLHGVDRTEARKRTEALLSQHGFLVKKTPHSHSVGHCQRCGTTIEPYLSKQWFVKGRPLADACIESHHKGEIQFIPERWTKVYLDWMINIRDWCISRQLWWGHQIPAWYCEADGCETVIVARETPTRCPACQGASLRQETDVLDTWFSSGLWPFSTMGWPNLQAADYQHYYPTSVLVTGFDIIFFWVARMTMLGLALTGESPFHTVYIHGLVRDEKGQKMSKSKGNTIDPVEIIDNYGCDALRFALTSLVTGGQDIKLSKDSFEQGKLFANKLWNASRFVLMNLEGVDDAPIDASQLSNMDRWILAQLRHTINSVNDALVDYRFSVVTDTLYEFIWNVFCDWYVEYAKQPLKDPERRANTQRILLYVLDMALRLLHPVMPHITEEIWQKLPHRPARALPDLPVPVASLSISAFPQAVRDAAAQAEMAEHLAPISQVTEVIREVRHVRQASGIAHSQETPLVLECPDAPVRDFLLANTDLLHQFLKLSSLEVTAEAKDVAPQALIGVAGPVRIIVVPAGMDIEAEVARQKKKLDTLHKEHQQLSQQLANPNFVERAPAAVVDKNRQRVEELAQQIGAIEAQLAQLVR